MTTNTHDYFEEFEIEHDFRTYYATGYVEYSSTQCIGGNYEGYDFELLYEKEIHEITITALWYFDEETGNAIEILNVQKHQDVVALAEEEIRYKYE